MLRIRSSVVASTLLVIALAASPAGCKKADAGASTAPDATTETHADAAQSELESRPAVDNWTAKVGDVTVCPISGKKFEVKADSGHFSYQGYDFVFCCSGSCLDKVTADPGKYLDKLVEQAGGPASDPDKTFGDAIDDG